MTMTSIMLREGSFRWDGVEVETYSDPCGHLRGKHSKEETEEPTAMPQEHCGTVRKNKAGSMVTAEQSGWLTIFI